MKIKILGTSNGIIQGGYAEALAGLEEVEIVRNLSIGSSHPTIIPLALQEDDPSAASDIFLLDMCVNEQRAASKRLYNIALSELLLEHFCAHCTEAGSVPLVLLLPTMDAEGRLNTDTVDRWAEICRRKDVPHLDVAALANRTGVPRDLWRDGHHPTSEFSTVIAQEIAATGSHLSDWSSGSFGETSVRVHYCTTGVPIERSTKLTTKAFRRLFEGEHFEIALPCGSDFEVLGVSLNMAQTHAALEFSGEIKRVQRFDNGYYEPRRSLWYVSWGLLKSARSRNGSIGVKVVQPRDTADQMKNDHITARLSHASEVVMEIEGIILRRI